MVRSGKLLWALSFSPFPPLRKVVVCLWVFKAIGKNRLLVFWIVMYVYCYDEEHNYCETLKKCKKCKKRCSFSANSEEKYFNLINIYVHMGVLFLCLMWIHDQYFQNNLTMLLI